MCADQIIVMQSKVYPRITGPHDYVNTPIIGLCMQEYFLRILGTYREFVELDEPDAESEAQEEPPVPGVRRTHQDDGYLRSVSPPPLLLLQCSSLRSNDWKNSLMHGM